MSEKAASALKTLKKHAPKKCQEEIMKKKG